MQRPRDALVCIDSMLVKGGCSPRAPRGVETLATVFLAVVTLPTKKTQQNTFLDFTFLSFLSFCPYNRYFLSSLQISHSPLLFVTDSEDSKGNLALILSLSKPMILLIEKDIDFDFFFF